MVLATKPQARKMELLSAKDIEILKAPFPPDVIGVKIQATNREKTKAMLVQYLQHTDVANRLEEIDPSWRCEISERWKDGDKHYARVVLTLKSVKRENIGEGDHPKDAASDAFKRAAMLFGVGRYLYDQERAWVPYNESKDRYRAWTAQDLPKASRPPAQAQAVSPETPQAGAGGGSAGDFVVKVGNKYFGKKLKDIPSRELIGFCDWLEAQVQKTGKPLSIEAKRFIEAVERYANEEAQEAGNQWSENADQ